MEFFRKSRWQGAASNAVLSSLGLTAGLFLAGCDDEKACGGAAAHARGELREIHGHLTALPEIVTNAGMPLDLTAVRQSNEILRDAYAGIDATLDGGTGSVPGEEDVTINRDLGRFLAVYVTHTGP